MIEAPQGSPLREQPWAVRHNSFGVEMMSQSVHLELLKVRMKKTCSDGEVSHF